MCREHIKKKLSAEGYTTQAKPWAVTWNQKNQRSSPQSKKSWLRYSHVKLLTEQPHSKTLKCPKMKEKIKKKEVAEGRTVKPCYSHYHKHLTILLVSYFYAVSS